MEYLIFDLIAAIVLVLAAVQGYRKGFVLTLCGFLAIFVAFVGASVLSNALAGPVSQAIRPAVEESVSDSLRQSLEEQGLLQGGDALSEGADVQTGGGEDFSLEEVLGLLQGSELVERFSRALQDALSEGLLEVTSTAAAAVAGYIALEIARMVLFILCFVLILAGWSLLSRALDLAFRLPVLSTLNQWAGAAVGLVKGGALLFMACWLFRGLLPQGAVEQTALLRFFCTANPFDLVSAIF